MLYKTSKDLSILNELNNDLFNKFCEIETTSCDIESTIELVDSDKGEYGLFIYCNKCNLNL